ncbi:MAG: AAA family ATPase, partial [Steroidobacteraceae bacterium]
MACAIDGLELAAEIMPVEAFASLQARLRNQIADVVRLHGGSMQEQHDDSGIALFGLPVAHDDDPARAARAALRIRTEVAACASGAGMGEIGARISIATGSVVARGGPPDLQVTGDVVANVRRNCALAGTAQIVVDERTCRRMLGLFEVRPLVTAPAATAGQPPLHLFALEAETGTGSRIDSIAEGQLTAFQGRDEELGILQRELRHACTGAGRLITVEGDAGLRKSRLVYEFQKRLHDGEVRVLSVRCHAHSAGTPYRPLADAVRALLAVTADAGATTPLHDLAVQRLLQIDPSLEIHLPLLLQVLGLPGGRFDSSEQRDEQEFRSMAAEAIASTLVLAARERPLVL